MDAEEYRKQGKAMVDRIADYLTNVRDYDVLPQNVYPGYLKDILPERAPQEGEPFDRIAQDIDDVILPGTTHWQSPHMHAFFPALNSYASLLGDMMADAINCLGFTWESSPICTELEIVVMNWLCEALGLPDKFKHARPSSFGGGVIYTTCSEATLSAMMVARKRAIDEHKTSVSECGCRNITEADILSRLVAYCSDQAHSSVEKASMLCMVKLRHLPTDNKDKALRGSTLLKAIHEDKAKGLIPFFVCATLGTTGICAFDNLYEIGHVAKDNRGLWVHVDAAYAGSAFICPELRQFMEGMELAQSFAFNPSKWMMVHFDCTAFWVEDYRCLENTFCINPVYLMHDNMDKSVDFMHWQIPLSRRFRALKLWFVLRSFGISGIQKHIRHGIEMAIYFEELMKSNKIFQIKAKRHLGLVVFQLKNNSGLTKKLLSELLSSRKFYAVPAVVDGETVIRFTVTSPSTTKEDIEHDWKLIEETGLKVLADDYDKCFAGECLTCSKRRSRMATTSRPSIRVTNSLDYQQPAIDQDPEVSGKNDMSFAVGTGCGLKAKPDVGESGVKGVGFPIVIPIGSDRSEEGSHLEGNRSNCDSDEEYCPSERQTEDNYGGKDEGSPSESEYDYVTSFNESKEHFGLGKEVNEQLISKDWKEVGKKDASQELDLKQGKVQSSEEEKVSIWKKTGNLVGRLGRRMSNVSL